MAKRPAQTTEPVKSEETTSVPEKAAPAFKFKKKRSVTRVMFKWANNVERYFKIEKPMFEAKPLKKATAADLKKKPPTLAEVIDLPTGEEGQITCSEVLKDALNQGYPNDGYVGKSFAIMKHAIEGDKKYATFSIVEIEVE